MGARTILSVRAGRVVSALGAGLTAALLAGCGVTHAISSVVDPAAQAADVTARAPGFRMAMTMRMTSNGSALGQASGTGSFTRAPRAGAFSFHEHVAGHDVVVAARFIHEKLYMNAGALSAGHALPGGKHWISYDLGQALGTTSSGGLAGMNSDPSQFLRYLHAAGSRATRLGHASIRGVPTTGYHVMVDLNRYAGMLPAAQRPVARQLAAITHRATGRTTLPFDVWIDATKRLRRMSFALTECAAGREMGISMVMDMYDFGPQPAVTAPPASDTYDITSRLRGVMKHLPLGCGASA